MNKRENGRRDRRVRGREAVHNIRRAEGGEQRFFFSSSSLFLCTLDSVQPVLLYQVDLVESPWVPSNEPLNRVAFARPMAGKKKNLVMRTCP